MRTRSPAFRSPRAARLSPLAAGIALALSPSAALATTYPVADAGEFIAAISTAISLCASDPAPLIQATAPFTVSTSTGMPSFGLPAFSCAATAFNPVIDGGGAVNPASTGGFDTNVTLNGAGSFASCGLQFLANSFYGGKLTVKGMKIENFTYGSLASGVCGALELHDNLLTQNSVGATIYYDQNRGSVVGDVSNGGNVITNNDYGLYVYDTVLIENNKIGTANGTTAAGNTYGVYLNFPNGTTTVNSNLISGNSSAGIWIYGDYGGSVISNNYIGTTADGDSALANGDGIYVIYSGSPGMTISGNTIGGNGSSGVYIGYSSDATIDGNSVGMGFSGVGSMVPNGIGIDAYCTNNLTVDSNNVWYNTGDGLQLYGADGTTVSSNTFDQNANGVRITSGTTCFQYGSFNTLDSNEINDNRSNGVLMTGFGSGNSIIQGHIAGNATKNISLNGGTLPLPNDVGDIDGGPNHQQNYPVITSVVQNGSSGNTTINFSVLDLNPADQFEIAFYSNPGPLGKPAGANYEGSTTVYGGTTGSVVLGGLLDFVSATATDTSLGDTSEFSAMKAAVTAPAVFLSPSSKDFGNVEINTSSATTTFLLRSLGDQPYVISGMFPGSFCLGDQAKANAFTLTPPCYGGAFICSTTCQADVDYTTNMTCSVSARFAPTFTGFQTDSICIFDNTADSPHFINLAGTGVLPPPLVIEPTAFDFGNVPVGASSEPMRFRVTNRNPYGAIPVTVATIGGEFTVLSEDCTPSIASGANCNVDVTFDPSTSGDQLGKLVVAGKPPSDASKQAFTLLVPEADATLQGVGVSGGQLNLPNAIDMGGAQVGGAAISFPVELRNTGYGTLTLSTISVASPFTLVNPCPATLAPAQACTITLQFAATSLGEVHGDLTVVSSAEGGSKVIPVTARGQTVATPLLRIQPTAMGFGSRIIGSLSPTQEVTITNIGGAQASLDLSLTSIDFLISGNTCGATLAAQASCTANVGFRPLGFGPRTGSFTVTGNASNAPVSVTVGGTGCRPFAAGSSRLGSSGSCAP